LETSLFNWIFQQQEPGLVIHSNIIEFGNLRR